MVAAASALGLNAEIRTAQATGQAAGSIDAVIAAWMLYHVPDSRFYEQTVAEVWFDSAESAEAAGFQPLSYLATADSNPDQKARRSSTDALA